MDGSLGEFERIHHQSSCRPRTTSDILTAISDDRSPLFNAIGLMPAGTGILIRQSGPTRREYYPRAGLISKQNGKYFLTTLDKVVYNLQRLVGEPDYAKKPSSKRVTGA
jgi:hypothetical protein